MFAQVVLFLKQHKVSEKELLFMLYLTDLYAIKWTDKQITPLTWFLKEGSLQARKSFDSPMKEDLPLSLRLILKNIVTAWVGNPNLFGYVQQTEPIKNSQGGVLNLFLEKNKLLD